MVSDLPPPPLLAVLVVTTITKPLPISKEGKASK